MESLEQNWLQYPIFHIDFNGDDYTVGDTLADKIEGALRTWEGLYGENPNSVTTGDRFAFVLLKAFEKTGHKPVVLVDEYDKPLLDVMGHDRYITVDGEKMLALERNKALLKGFYSVLKSADKILTFAMLTGVTMFSQISVFSGFNQPDDISFSEEYESICGITEEELHSVFKEPIEKLAAKNGCSAQEMKLELKRHYDGYHFSTNMRDVYNPFSLIKCFNDNEMDDYWFATGSPTFLIRLLNSAPLGIKSILDEEYKKAQFIDYKADAIEPLPMVYQSGYLTIKEFHRDTKTFKLDFPNTEVREGFVSLLASNYYGIGETQVTNSIYKIVRKLREGDVEGFMDIMTAYMADIPYTMRRGNSPKEYERFFHLIFYLTLRLVCGYIVFAEKQQSHGRCDCILETERFIYIIEFKLDGSVAEALQQIEDKGYATPYKADARQLFKLGAVFSSETGTITDYKLG